EYCFSIIVMTFKRGTDVYYIPPGGSTASKSLPYTLLTLLLGWWGFPWGFIYTPMAIATNLGGGRNVTKQVLASLTAGRPAWANASQLRRLQRSRNRWVHGGGAASG